MKVRPNFVRLASFEGMALRTARLEDGGTLGSVTGRVRHFERYLCSQAEVKSRKTSEGRSWPQSINFCTQSRAFPV